VPDRQIEMELNEAERLATDLRETILPLGVALAVERDLNRLLERVVVEAMGICRADAGVLFLRQEECLNFAIVRVDSLQIALGGTSSIPAPYQALCLDGAEAVAPDRLDPALYVALHGQLVHVPDIYEAALFDFSGIHHFDQKYHYRSQSALLAPLLNHDGVAIGVLQLMNAQDQAGIIPFDAYHQLVVESLASQAAVALNNRLLLKRQEELLTIERDLQIGRQIQGSFLPLYLPQPPGWELAARFQPAREVAGDFYDAFPLAAGRIGFVVADVSEKGVGAALFMALTRSLIRAYAQEEYYSDTAVRSQPTPEGEPATWPRHARSSQETLLHSVGLTNDYIFHNHGQAAMFATLFFGILDPATGQVTYINAGHNPPVVIGAEAGNDSGAATARPIKEQLAPTGLAIGARGAVPFRVAETWLAPGDLLLAYTDGVTEAPDPHGLRFGQARLLSLLTQPTLTANTLLDRIESQVRRHMVTAAQADDITILALRRL
jgi:phosphoserine phosphatase RsbU/P